MTHALEWSLIGAGLLVASLMVVAGVRWRLVMKRESRIALTGGGTGGHVNPALAIAEGIKNREPEARFLYIGVRDKAEAVIVERVGFPLRFVRSEGFPGLKPSLRLLRFMVVLMVGVVQAAVILLTFAPRWVIATGGYVSAPGVIAALILQWLRVAPCKVFMHEQNSVPGQLNAVLGRYATRVLLTFPQTLSFFPKNGVVVGYPVRHSIMARPRAEVLNQMAVQIPEGSRVIFVFGGSQGARTINRAIIDALPYLLPYRKWFFVFHGVGLAKSADYDAEEDSRRHLEATLSPEEMQQLEGFYYFKDYFYNIADIYSVSELIVCRSGAGSLNEISRIGKPALLIPKVNLPGDHQVMNARAMKHAGAAEVLFEDTVVEDGKVLEKVEGRVLAERILRLMLDPLGLEAMGRKSRSFFRRNANERIVSELYGDESYNNGVRLESVPFQPLLSNQQLLRTLSAAYRQSPGDYDPSRIVPDADDLAYYQHRAAGLLSHEAWQDRNVGVKLIGLSLYREKLPTLLHMLVDRTPDRCVKRWLGGDYKQVGFIRRNIVQALRVLKVFNANVEKRLLTAAEDPYYEVRSQVCRTIAFFGANFAGKESCVQTLLKRLDDRSFEVVVEAAQALGEVGVDGRVLEALLTMREHPRWQVRDAALRGMRRLLERRVISPSEQLLSEIDRFILTATDFRPYFSIKETYRAIDAHCHNKSADQKGSGDSRTTLRSAGVKN